jgi:hypothetical protein
MNREAKIADKIVRQIFAGTWALPNTPAKAEKIVGGVRNMGRGKLPDGGIPDKKTMAEDVADYFDNLLGDDELFDDIGDLAKRFKEPEEFLRACAISIRSRIGQLVKDGKESFRDPQAYENLIKLNRQIK